MLGIEDIFLNVMSTYRGKEFDFCLIDFSLACSNVPPEIRSKIRNFQTELVRTFVDSGQSCIEDKHRFCKWTIEFIWSTIVDDVINFNKTLRSTPEEHTLIYICSDKDILPTQQALLKRSYIQSEFFQLHDTDTYNNYETIFNYLRQGKDSQRGIKIIDYFYPLYLHANSISSGLFFNYYYSYLNRQVGSTNNLSLTFIFNKRISRETFSSNICVVLNTLIEEFYLDEYPLTTPSDILVPWQSNPLVFVLDSVKYRDPGGNETTTVYYVPGVGDFGKSVEKIRIWQEKLDLEALVSIQLQDDIRHWNQIYVPCSSIDSANKPFMTLFTEENNSDRQCQFLPFNNRPNDIGWHGGISTMKKTTKDCYDLYITDQQNGFNENGQRIVQVRIVPKYYILALSSCNFGPPDTNKVRECDETTFQGIITDPDELDRIHLAYANMNAKSTRDVLRSPPMLQYDRYLRRTYYYFDEVNENDEIIRYLFCGEYPYILSILNRMEQIGLISKAQKRDEYLRFCNMINRILVLDNLSDSIKLIQFDDEERHNFKEVNASASDQVSFADSKSLWTYIKEDIQQYYERSNEDISSLYIIPKILSSEPNRQVMIFLQETLDENQWILSFITNLKDKLKEDGYSIDDITSDLNAIEGIEQVIFICTGKQDEYVNRQMMQILQRKMNHFGVLRDVFVLINEAICYFPCQFIRSIPYITFDLNTPTSQLINHKIEEVIYYLKNMNILSKSYTDLFDNNNDSAQELSIECTSIGVGCAAAFYFNYAELLIPLTDHRLRMEKIYQELYKEKRLAPFENGSIFIWKWIFVFPWTIANSSQLISHALSLNEDERKTIGFKLTEWKATNGEFINPNITITVGGIYQRSYSPLFVYNLTNLVNGKSFYFAMEIPAALRGLQNQYQNLVARFNFGRFNPSEQAVNFREQVQEYKTRDQNAEWHKWVMFVSLNTPATTFENNPTTPYEQAKILLTTLWERLSLSVQSTT